MTIEEALSVLDGVLGQITLNDTQELVFRHAWEDWTYEQIAEQFGYTTDYVKNVGSQLWDSLSHRLGVRVTKRNVQSVVRRWARQQCSSVTPTSQTVKSRDTRQDLGEAPDVSSFAGRVEELETVKQWVTGDRSAPTPTTPCRLIALLGMGGMGKTSLAVMLARQVESQFDAIVWRSLRNAPPVEELLGSLIQFLSNGAETESTLPGDRHSRMTRLIEHLRSQRCLIILDNAESVLPCHEPAKELSDTGYSELLDLLSDLPHEGCVVLTSREKPDAIAWKEGVTLPVRSLQLSGLNNQEAQAIFASKGHFVASEAEWQTLIQHYAGNPLALKMVAAAIQEIFNSNISEFLRVLGTLVFDDIRDLLDRQFNRLSFMEKEVMFWIAVNREVISFTELRDDILCPISRQKLPGILRSLKHRFLIEATPDGFTQQPVVMEYVTNRFIEQISREILAPSPSPSSPVPLLQTHALLKATTKDYIRDSQTRLILAPITDRLLALLRSPLAVEQRCRNCLAELQQTSPPLPGYAAGNLINLLHHFQTDLAQLNLSKLTIRQAQFQKTDLHYVNLENTEIVRSVFLESLGAVWSVAFSPDGTLLAAGDSAGDIHFWRVADHQKVITCKGHTNWVCAIAFSPDGKTLASGSVGNVVKLWDVATGQCRKTLRGHAEWVIAVAFSPDGRLLATSGADRMIKLWNPVTGACVQTIEAHVDWVCAISFSPDSSLLVSGSDDATLKLWAVQTATCLQTFTGHSSHVRAVMFSPDGERLASGSSDGTVKLWNVSSGKCLHTLTGHTRPVRSVAYAPAPNGDRAHSELVSSSEDGSLRRWEDQTGHCLAVLHGHSGHIRSVAIHPKGQLAASGSADQTVKLWNLQTGHCLRTLRGYTNFVLAVACAPIPDDPQQPQLIASGHSDRAVRVWNLQTGECLQTLKGHTNEVWGVAFSPDGQRLASSSTDQTIRLWDVKTGECLNLLRGHTDWIHAIAFSPDGQRLASSSSDQTIRLWDSLTGSCLKTLHGHDSHVWSVAFSPTPGNDGGWILASSSDDQTVKLWNVTTGECTQTFTGHTRRVQAVTFSPDGAWLASSSSDQTIAIWDVRTGRCLRTLTNDGDHVRSLAFSSFQSPFFQQTGHLLLASYAENSVKVWDANTGECFRVLEGHTSRIWSVTLSPDGQTLISGGEDGTLRLWDIELGKCVALLQNFRPYEGMAIAGIRGLTDAQKTTLKSLGAVE
ncbi:MAG: AAA family ATPase [Oscillatoriales cyanobacterium C42_A2020_001]|nr:AAA family ATPase [Leptolyngbyaceae cyanobacterium C42_A2020_001]